MNNEEQVKNILTFLTLIFGDSDVWHDEIMKFPPYYLIDKFNRYVMSTRGESMWGIHPSLRKYIFNKYCEKWKISIDENI